MIALRTAVCVRNFFWERAFTNGVRACKCTSCVLALTYAGCAHSKSAIFYDKGQWRIALAHLTNKLNNCRPVTLMNTIEKFFMIMYEKLRESVEMKKLLITDRIDTEWIEGAEDNISLSESCLKHVRKKIGKVILHVWMLKRRIIGWIENSLFSSKQMWYGPEDDKYC